MNTKSSLGLKCAFLLCASALAYPAISTAQEAGAVADGGFKDIVVTARKREESLLSVPVAVTAIGGDALARTASSNLTKLNDIAPQVALVKGFSGTGASFSIRGLGSSFLDAGFEQTVAVNIDGVPIGRGNIVTSSFFDTQQVEIMKGPQALFFGKNSPAGVIAITSKDPGKEFEGYGTVGYEFVGREKFVEGAVSGPVSDTLGLRLAVRASDMDGYLINQAQAGPYIYAPNLTNQGAPSRRQPQNQSIAGRVTAVWTPTDKLQAKFKIVAGHYEDNDTGGASQNICFAPLTAPVVGPFGPDPYSNCKLDKYKASGSIPAEIAAGIPGYRKDGIPKTLQDTLSASLAVDYDFDNFTLSSVTGYYKLDYDASFLPDRTSLAPTAAYIFERNDTFTQELRLRSNFDAPFNFMIGGYYEHANYDTGVNALVFFVGPDPATGLFTSGDGLSKNKNRAYSVFGQGTFDITPTVELAGGARWTREEKDGLAGNTYVNPNPSPFPGAPSPSQLWLTQGVLLNPEVTEENVSPEATLTWRPSTDLTVYGAYKTGYKSGGISNPTIIDLGKNAQNLTFGDEKAKGFEAGVKGYFLDRTLRAELTAYTYKYSDLQVSSFDPATISFLVQNAAEATVEGAEFALDWRATPELSFNTAVGYNRARYDSYVGAPCGTQINDRGCTGLPSDTQDLKGVALVRAPDWTGNIGVAYDTHMSSDIMLGLTTDVNFSSSYYTQEDANALAQQDGFTKLNASARVYSSDDKWELSLIGRNLTNEYTMLFTTDMLFGGANQFIAGTARPREVVVQGTYRF